MQPFSVRPSRRGSDFSQELARRGWYHSFDLPDGTHLEGWISVDILRWRYGLFPIPADLTGKRLLDIGAWDGWFSFEAERRGAAVTAIDCVEVPQFLEIRRKLSSRADYRILDFYELPEAGLGSFDYVFFLGVLYHLKHPLLALEIVCGMTADTAIVESFVTDGDTWQEHTADVPAMEFYETDELGNQLDNWIGPSVGCLLAMCRAAGFARVELLYAQGNQGGAVCYRKWEPPADPRQDAPELVGVANTRTTGINFSTRKEEYISCWFRTAQASVTREQLRFEVGGFGVPALYARHEPDGRWLANFRFPPGLRRGWNEVRLRFANSDFGRTLHIAVDTPVEAGGPLVLVGACDGFSFRDAQIAVVEHGYVSAWVQGLPQNCDCDNVRVFLGSARLKVDYVGEQDADGNRQVNAVIPGNTGKGDHLLRIECAGLSSESLAVKIL
jgi:tRNA (mo5U34)-methyltransferase